MRNPFVLSVQDAPYKGLLQEALAEDLYRRARMPIFVSFPVMYVFYLVIADVVPRRPIIGWIFAVLFVLLVLRLTSILVVGRIKARYPDPKIRTAIFAIGAALLGAGMAAVNIIAAPIVSAEQLALMAIIAAGINSIAITSMGPSLGSYLFYMVPNIASMSIAILIGPNLEYGGFLLFLTFANLFSMFFMAAYVHFKERRSILLRLQVDDANAALQKLNKQLKSEIEERLAAEASLEQRNTELEVVNHKLAGAQSQLLQSEKMASVGQLAAGVAHEINNPIAFVGSNLISLSSYMKEIVSVLDAYEEVVLAPGSADVARQKLEQLKISTKLSYLLEDIPSLLAESADGITRVEKIVKDLKEFSHLDEAEWQCVDIHQGLESTLNIAAHEIRSKADIVRDYGELPLIECLPAQINQVFLHLLVNAAQSIEGRGTISVHTGRDEDSIWVRIADTGKGIEPAQIGRIFDPFFTTKPVGVGPGLGLSVSYSVVKQHGGSIEVVSEVGKGTAFTVRLPIRTKRPGSPG